MRAEPPPPPRRRPRDADHPQRAYTGPRRRCPYLEQILRESAGPFGMLIRYKADCHVDRRTHKFTGRNPMPPCITEPESCALYQAQRGDEDRQISRYTD
ncbi:MAG TPA: hypothetical protein VFC09_15520 [Candidatus Dormibacteraeota bacterium]|nr:hypothetical protein [Candidatus Dormibacteraeota bacterium]